MAVFSDREMVSSIYSMFDEISGDNAIAALEVER